MKKILLAALLLFPLAARAQQQTLPPLRIQEEGSNLPIRFKLNCVGAGITCSDDASNHRTLITIASASGTVTSITMGTGLSSTQSPLTTTGTMSINQAFTPTWSGVHTFGASPTWGTDNTYSFGDATHRAVGLFSIAYGTGASTGTFTTTVASANTGFIFNHTNGSNDIIASFQQGGTEQWYLKANGGNARVGCNSSKTTCEYGSPSFNSEIAITNTQVQLLEGSTAVNVIASEMQPGTDKTLLFGDSTHGWKRAYLRGTSAVAGDYAASGGFGATSSFGTITGDDNHGRFTLTTSGNGEGANPTITYTFHDGTWTNAPFCLVHLESTTDTIIDTVQLTQSSSATALTMTYNGTPVDAKAYTFAYICVGG